MNEILNYNKFEKFSKNWEKYVFYWENLHFEDIGNYVHTTLALAKALNIYINYSMFHPNSQHAKLKHFKYGSLHSTMIS